GQVELVGEGGEEGFVALRIGCRVLPRLWLLNGLPLIGWQCCSFIVTEEARTGNLVWRFS
ncbi:MAG: hypothetical protein VX723_03455, partial [Candidatus Thermoplasmatota archaeon]|nr:hypothetical protein [Candidatus Thermoplasmatota archaeon]